VICFIHIIWSVKLIKYLAKLSYFAFLFDFHDTLAHVTSLLQDLEWISASLAF
jgi:hypothetical protein